MDAYRKEKEVDLAVDRFEIINTGKLCFINIYLVADALSLCKKVK